MKAICFPVCMHTGLLGTWLVSPAWDRKARPWLWLQRGRSEDIRQEAKIRGKKDRPDKGPPLHLSPHCLGLGQDLETWGGWDPIALSHPPPHPKPHYYHHPHLALPYVPFLCSGCLRTGKEWFLGSETSPTLQPPLATL